MSLTLALERQKQAYYLWVQGQHSPQNEFQVSQGYIERLLSQKQKTKLKQYNNNNNTKKVTWMSDYPLSWHKSLGW